jgi:hypothetical protein
MAGRSAMMWSAKGQMGEKCGGIRLVPGTEKRRAGSVRMEKLNQKMNGPEAFQDPSHSAQYCNKFSDVPVPFSGYY